MNDGSFESKVPAGNKIDFFLFWPGKLMPKRNELSFVRFLQEFQLTQLH